MIPTPVSPTHQLNPLFSLSLDTFFSDSRFHGYQGPSRNISLQRASNSSGGSICRNEDGTACVVAGKDSLRILKISDSTHPPMSSDHKVAVGAGGCSIYASKNMWDGSGLKIDSAITDVAWGLGIMNNKVVTSAMNGELIIWDIYKPGPKKYERRSKIHTRSINKISMSQNLHYYCLTGSADRDIRIWDLRDMSKSVIQISHATSVRSVAFSPSRYHPLQVVVGLDNGTIHRWDLSMGQRGKMDRIPVAHSGPVMSLDWTVTPSFTNVDISGSFDESESEGGAGWLASGGLDRSVKVWDLSSGLQSRNALKAAYTLHPAFPVRRVVWRPGYECELAIVPNVELGIGTDHVVSYAMATKRCSPIIPTVSGVGTLSDEEIGGKGQKAKDPLSVTGDPIEIWDVRRGYIAKWAVGGSFAEGGVTDITFGDSHAIWAQHCSGTFSQLDLRDCTKPVDAIPRVSAAWEATGSLAFTVNKNRRWEVPYDDIGVETRTLIEERKFSLKALGDGQYQPKSQKTGVHSAELAGQELAAFSRLAKAYVFNGASRKAVCESNAKAAHQAGKIHASQTWWLMSTFLTDLVPLSFSAACSPLPTKSPMSLTNAELNLSGSYTFPLPNAESHNSLQSGSHHISPGRQSSHRSEPAISSSTSRKLTPTSSTSSSPRRPPSLLPSSSQRASLFGRRPSTDANVELTRQHSLYRRPSLSVQSASPGDKSIGSLRHVGEGALDDSDSSGSDRDRTDACSSDEETSLRPLISPAPTQIRIAPTQPSPLSRVAGQQQWTDDERDRHLVDDEKTSPSPGSTDTESGGSTAPFRTHRSPSTTRRMSHRKSRSRNSTVATLAANAFTRTLVKQESHSSIRTVTAYDSSVREEEKEREGGKFSKDSLERSRVNDNTPVVPPIPHHRQKSQATASDFVLNSVAASDGGDDDREEEVDPAKQSERNPLAVRAEEEEFRELGWQALREILEGFADEVCQIGQHRLILGPPDVLILKGDSQMCAMMSIIAPKELKISRGRVGRFLESYIDLLVRLRLHTSAAYLRKYTEIENFETLTRTETVLYTACGRCRKAVMFPAGAQKPGDMPKGGYAYCLSCRNHFVRCSICRLPVRALLFQCSVCNHGGHQDCYRRYYMQRPMVEISFTAQHDTRGRTLLKEGSSRGGESDGGDTDIVSESLSTQPRQNQKLYGHPCVAGCGHYCWAANEIRGGNEIGDN